MPPNTALVLLLRYHTSYYPSHIDCKCILGVPTPLPIRVGQNLYDASPQIVISDKWLAHSKSWM
eukprot:1417825-Ditylum_brightwellii.AAC.1